MVVVRVCNQQCRIALKVQVFVSSFCFEFLFRVFVSSHRLRSEKMTLVSICISQMRMIMEIEAAGYSYGKKIC